MNLSPEERKRRAQVIRIDIRGEFWALIKAELEQIAIMKDKDSLYFLTKNNADEAKRFANEAAGIRLAINCPEEILKYHYNVYTRITSKLKEIIN